MQDLLINAVGSAVRFEDLGSAAVLVAESADLHFDRCAKPAGGWSDWHKTQGSSENDYIPANPDGSPHILPAGAAIVLLKIHPDWDCPSEAHWQLVRQTIEETSGLGELYDTPRLRRLIGLHLGGWQHPATPLKDSRIEWWSENFQAGLGSPNFPLRDWYHGNLEGRDANGWSNCHYNGLLFMTVAMAYAPEPERQAAWFFYLSTACAYVAFGRFWSGPMAGYSRGEKGHEFVGRDNRGIDYAPYEKDWCPNLLGPALTTQSLLFRRAAELAANFYINKNPSAVWGGAWGARIPARLLENQLSLWMMLPEYRFGLEQRMSQTIAIMDYYLDDDEALWPNLGNGGNGPISGWMQSEACAVLERWREQVGGDNLNAGIEQSRVAAVMDRVMDTSRGTQGGSEEINGFPCLRSRFANNTGEPMGARFLCHAGFALPALRLLRHPEWTRIYELVTDWAGSEVRHLRAGTPRPIDEIGYRDPPSGPAAPKTFRCWLDGMR